MRQSVDGLVEAQACVAARKAALASLSAWSTCCLVVTTCWLADCNALGASEPVCDDDGKVLVVEVGVLEAATLFSA